MTLLENRLHRFPARSRGNRKRRGNALDARARMRVAALIESLEPRVVLSGDTVIPLSFSAVAPLGSQIYTSTISDQFNASGETSRFSVSLAAGQSLSLKAVPHDSSIQTEITLLDPDSNVIGWADASATGSTVFLQNQSISTPGTYEIDIYSLAGQGSFDLVAAINASFNEATNLTLGSAQDISSNFRTIDGTAASVGGVVGSPYNINAALGATVTDGTGSGAFNGDLSTITDGVFLPRGQGWTDGTVWWTGSNDPYSDPNNPKLEIDLGGTYSISGFRVQADNNDSYDLEWHDPSSGNWHWLSFAENLSWVGINGVITRPDTDYTDSAQWNELGYSVMADKVRIFATGGDGLYSVSEVQLRTDHSDHYALTLSAGENVTLAVSPVIGGAVGLDLLDPFGNVIASGVPNSDGTDVRITGYTIPYDDTYYARITGYSAGEYNLAITRNASLENAPYSTNVNLDATGLALGWIPSSGFADYYTIDLNSEDFLTISTSTPGNEGSIATALEFLEGGGSTEPVNTLDPSLELYDPDGNLLAWDDNGTGDGHNASLSFVATTAGRYRIAVSGASGTGAYILSVNGATGSSTDPGPLVESTALANGRSVINYTPDYLDVNYSSPIDGSNLNPGQFTIDGFGSADWAELIGPSTVRYYFYSLPSGEATFSYTVAPGAALDYQGVANDAYSGAFTVDLTGPHVVSYTVTSATGTSSENTDLTAPVTTVTFTFNEAIDPDSYVISSFVDPNGGTLWASNVDIWENFVTVSFQGAGLIGTYSLTIDAYVHDLAGNPMDQNQDGTNAGVDDTYTAQFTIVHSPDLVANSISTTVESSQINTVIPVGWNISNGGDADANDGWYAEFYLSPTPTFDSNTFFDTAVYLTNVWENSLAQGASLDDSSDITIRGNVTAGTWYLALWINRNHDQAESNPTNNIVFSAEPLQIVTPDVDIVPTSIGLSNALASVGDTVNVSWTGTIQGTESTNASWWVDTVYLSPTPTYDPATAIYLNAAWHYQGGTSSPLNPGDTYSNTANVSLPGNLVVGQTYYLLAKLNTDTYWRQDETEAGNNAVAAEISIIAPASDLVITIDPSTIPSNVSAGGYYYPSYRVTNQGVGDTTTPVWSNAFYISTTPYPNPTSIYLGETEQWGPLTAGTTYETDLFLPIPDSITPGSYYLVLVTDHNGDQTETDETNNITALPITVSSSDLIVTNVWGDSSASLGSEIYLAWTDFNQGGSPTASSYWYDTVYYSTTGALDGSEIYLGEFYQYSGGLDPGFGYDTGNYIYLPTWLSPGEGYLIIQTDTYNYNLDADQTNNTAVIPFSIASSDLIVSDASASAATATLGSTISVSWTVENQGISGTSAYDWYDAVYYSSTGLMDGSEIYLGNFYQYPGSLGAGGSYSVSNQTLTLPYAVNGGSGYLIIQADSYNYEYESDETNNSFIIPITLLGPDLAVTSASASTSTSIPGSTVSLSYSVTNQGDSPAANLNGGGWHDYYYISTNSTFDGSAQYIGSSFQSAVAPLAVGGSYSVIQQSVTLPGDLTSGQYYLYVFTDAYARFDSTYSYYFSYYATPDKDLSNNASSAIPITINTPDLTITTATAPSSAILNQTVNISWTVQNSSTYAASASYWYDAVYLSNTPDLSGSYTSLSDFYISGGLSPSGSYVQNRSVIISNNLGTGSKYLVFKVNSYSYQGESNTGNNLFALPITLSAPDLIVSAVSSSATTASVNQTIPVSWTVTDSSTTDTAAQSWYDRVYLSTSPNSISGATSLGEFFRTNSPIVLSNGSYTQNQNVTIPNSLAPGTYYLIVQTDINNYQGETNENNNRLSSSNPITIGRPDLVITSATSPSAVVSNQSISISWTVTNQDSTYTAPGPWYDYVHLVGPGGYDQYIGLYYNSSLVPLGPGANYTQTVNITIPNNTPSGEYSLVFQTNYQYYWYYSYQGESDSSNNTYTIPITIGAPDLSVDNSVNPPTAPSSASAGQNISVAYTVNNLGSTSAPGPWFDAVYLSPTPTYNSSTAIYQTGAYSSSNGHSPLSVGGSYQNGFSFNLQTNGLSGSVYLLFMTDRYNDQGETNETNNLVAVPLTVTAADLQVQNLAITPNSGLQTGNQVTLNWNVINTGNADVSSSFTDRITLRNLTTSQTLLTTYLQYDASTRGSILAGGSTAQQMTIQIPDGFSAVGDLQFTVTTDYSDVVPEGNASGTASSNNAASVSAQTTLGPYADLSVAAISPPATAWSGQTITVGWTVQNLGTAATTASWTDAIYVKNVSTGLQTLLGTVANPIGLAINQTYTRAADFKLPVGLTGDFVIVVTTNSNNGQFEANTANNFLTSSTFPISLTPYPDLLVSSITVPSGATAGQPVTISWTVTNNGTGGTDVPSWNDRVYLSTSPTFNAATAVSLGTVQNPSYLAVGESYGSSLTATVPSNLSGPFYAIIVTDSGNTEYEYTFENNNTATSSSTINVVPAPAPGFIHVASVSVTPNPVFAGQMIQVNWTIENTGSSTIPVGGAGYWDDGFALSQTPVWDGINGYWLGGHQGVPHTTDLAPGQTSSHYSQVTLPQNLTPGTWYLIVVPDTHYFAGGNGQIGAGNIPRDQGYATLTINLTTQPDLQVTSLTGDDTGTAGNPINVSWTVTNKGVGPTGSASWTDSVYISTSSTFQLNNATLLGNVQHTGILGTNEPYAVPATGTFTLPASLVTGTYYIHVVTDRGNNVFEYNANYNAEANNTLTDPTPLQVTGLPAPPKPDLATAISSVPGSAFSGQSLNLGWTVTNIGTGDTTGSAWIDQVILSHDDSLTTTADNVVLGNFLYPSNPVAGASYSQNQTVTLPIGISGSYTLFVVANSSQSLSETITSNNSASAALEVTLTPPPDLQITNVTVPAGASGQPITVQWTVTNNGPGATPPSQSGWVDRVYFSANSTLNGTATLLGSTYHNGALDPSDSYTQSATYTLPNGISGNFYIIIQTDSGNQVFEATLGELNNVASASVPVTLTPAPDLQIQSISAPADAIAGQPIAISWSTVNAGAGATPNGATWYESVYLSRDQFLNKQTAIYLGAVQNQSALAAGGVFTNSLSAIVPGSASGPYYVFVVTDATNTLYEGPGPEAQTNNGASSPTATVVTLPPQTDLIVGSITVPASGVVGLAPPSPITFQITNISGNTAYGSWNDAVYLSSNPIWDPSDALIALVPHSGNVAPGGSYTGSTSAPLPAAAPGLYYIIVRADIRNNIRETDETNNTIASSSTIAMDMQALTLDVPTNGSIANGQAIHYRVQVEAGKNLLIDASFAKSVEAEFYVRFGAPATRNQYDAVYSNLTDLTQHLLLSNTHAGNYYILLYGREGATSAGAAFSLTASTPSFSITSVSPNHGSNVGEATAVISGLEFTPNAFVTLVQGGNTRQAIKVLWKDSNTLWATFDLTGLTAGSYDVQVTDGARSTTKPGAYTVTSTPAGNLEFQLITSTVRPDGTSQVTIVYTNTGDTDITAPLFILSADGGILQPLGQTAFNSTSIHFLGTNHNGPAGILTPGFSGQIVVNFRPTVSSGFVNFTLSTAASLPSTIDWSAVKNVMKNPYVSSEAWDAIFANFTTIVGSTTSQYVSVLDGVATYLSQIGQPTSDLTALIQYVVQMAGDDIPALTLVSTLDTTNPGPGLPLSLTRSYLTPIEDRFRLGRFGRGWADEWDAQLMIDPSTGEVAILINGASRLFAPSASGYLPESDPASSLVNESGSFTYRDGSGLSYVFRADGTLGSVTDINGNRVTAVYTGSLLTQLVSTNGDSLTFTYNGQGRVSQMTDAVGRVTTYTYDPSGQHLLQVAGPNGIETYTYSAALTGPTAFELLTASLADGTQYTFSYDTRGRLKSRSLAGGAQTYTYSYGEQGQVSITNPLGATQTTLYTLRGQAAHVYDPLGNATTYGYDPNGNLTSLIAPGGLSYSFTHDSRGNIASVTDPQGHTSNFTYNSITNAVATATNANGKTTTFGYDSLGNLLSITYPGGQQLGISYNPLGEATQWTNARGQAVSYTYDSAGLVTTATIGGVTTTYTYDSHRNPISATDASGTTTFSYDSADRLMQVTYPTGNYLQFTYDSYGRRTQSVDQSGYTINYSYNSLNQLTGLTDGGGAAIVAYTYDAAGNLATKTLGNGTSTVYTYDALSRTTGVINYATDGVTITSESLYSYDVLGRRTSATSLDGTWNYAYDADGQLTEASFVPVAGSPLSAQDLAYQYDAVGNLLSIVANGVTTNYTPNASNQYTTAGTTTYTYDLDGNLVTATTGGVTTTYTYDALNRLTGISTPAHDAIPADQWSFSYDPFGNLVKTIHNGQTTTNLIDPASALSNSLTGLTNVVATYDGSGSLIDRFIYGTSLVAMASAAGATSYYNFDGIGSTVALTGSDGFVLTTYAYLPYGGLAGTTGSASNPYQFNGAFGVSSLANGLNGMRARFYSSDLGRFLSQDPAGLAGGINPYTFGNNNPISNVDPWGLWFIDIGISGGAGWGGAVGIQIGSGGVTIYGGPGVTTPGVGVGVQFGAGNVSNTGIYVQGQGAVGPGVVGAAGSYSHQLTGNGAGSGSWQGGVGIGLGGSKATGAGAFLIGALHFGPEPTNPSQSAPAPVVQSHDPNDKIGPTGYGEAGFIIQTSPLSYRINFENDENASASARIVTVTDTLDSNINASTLQLTSVSWGSTVVNISAGQSFYNNFVPLGDGSNHVVQIQAGIDYSTNTITWTLTTIDLTTGQLADDGFLPPNNENHDGEGYVTFTVMPKSGLATGTVIVNEATIIFDTEAPIPTNQVLNTIDAGAPTSAVDTLPATSTDSDFTVSWSGQDDDGGSGIATYDVYVSDNGGAFTPWISGTTDLSATYHGTAGHTYAFFSRARDNAGNVEGTPSSADTQITIQGVVLPPSAPTGIAISPDTGSLSNDGITTASAITLSGSLTQTNLTVRIYDSTTHTDLGTAVVNGTDFSAVLNLAEGTHVLDITAVNADELSAGTTFIVVVDSTAPTAPAGLAITPDTGSLPNDGLTNTGNVTLTGLLGETGLTVNLFDTTTGTNLGAADVTGTGFSKTLNLAPGTHALQITATDAAGNVSSAGLFTVTVDNTGPTVTSVQAVSPNPRGSVVSALDVTFSEPIDLATFDWNDLSLTLNGGSNLITSAVSIGLVSGSTYQISGLDGLDTADGTYQLTVYGSGVSDPAGNNGSGSASSSWLMDTSGPASSVVPLTASQSSPSFTVSWSGQDNVGGSGIATFSIFVSDNGGAFTPWLTGTAATSAQFTGAYGHSYGFFSIATDAVGNTEATPAAAQATTTVVSTATSTAIVSSIASPTYGDLLSFTATVSIVAGDASPTGTIQFLIDGNTFGAPVPLVGGVATSDTIATIGAGTHTITTVYSGDGLYPSNSDGSLALSIAKAQLTIKANDAAKVYGQANPAFTASYDGFKNTDDASSLTTLPTLSTLATSASGVGDYDITASGASASNYDISYQTGTLSISKAQLTVTADNKVMGHGDPVPSLTYQVSGFVNGDNSSVISGSPTLATLATSASAAGQYAITVAPGSLTASNYDFSNLVPGTLTVQPKVVDIRVSWGSQSMSILGLNRNLPFATIKAIDVIFSDDVAVDSADLALISTLTAGKTYAPSAFSYDSSTRRATWTLPNAFDADKLRITLDGDGPADGNDGIHAPGGIYLGAYSASFAVLPGDFNGNNTVDSQDLVGIRNGMLGILDHALDIWADVNGDGKIDINDYNAAKKNVGKRF